MVKRFQIPLLLSLLFFLIGIFTISDYGINWDSQCRMMRGQAFAHLFLTGQKDYLGFSGYRTPPNLIRPYEYVTRYDSVSCDSLKQASLPDTPLPKAEYQEVAKGKRFSFYQHPSWNGNFFLTGDGAAHPPLPETLGAISNRIFWGFFGLLGDIESFSLIFLLFSASGVFIVSAFAIDITGSKLAGVIAGLSLGLYPLYFSEAHFNMKDPLQSSMYIGVVWALWKWIKEGGVNKFQILNFQFPVWWGVATIFLALALAIKWNIAFLPIILFFWFITIRKSKEFKTWFKLKTLLILFLFSFLFIIAFLIFIWPASWANPISWFQQVFIYYLSMGVGLEPGQPEGFKLPLGFNGYPLALFLTQTPEITLILGGLGVIGGISKVKNKMGGLKVEVLILLLILVPLIRYSLPFSKSYGGIRQVMEIIPALTILAGLGAHYIVKSLTLKVQTLSSKLKNIFIKFPILELSVIAVTFAALIFPIVKIHPNQNVYFNNLIGGIKGAENASLIDLMVTNGNVYKQGVEWLNKNAELNSKLAVTDGRMLAISPLWLRNDISVSPYHFSGLNKKGEYLLMFYNNQKRDYFAYHYPRQFLTPVHTIRVDGVPILYIFKNDLGHTKDGYKEETKEENFQVQRVSKPTLSYYQVSLPKKQKVTRIVVTNYRKKCPDKDLYTFTDEFITFPNSNKVYAINERNLISENQIEYSFPAEETEKIYIYPQSDNSCFIGGKILSINVLR